MSLRITRFNKKPNTSYRLDVTSNRTERRASRADVVLAIGATAAVMLFTAAGAALTYAEPARDISTELPEPLSPNETTTITVGTDTPIP